MTVQELKESIANLIATTNDTKKLLSVKAILDPSEEEDFTADEQRMILQRLSSFLENPQNVTPWRESLDRIRKKTA